MNAPGNARALRDWTITEWSEKLCLIVESMADERPAVERSGASGGKSIPSQGEDIWQQAFSVSPEPLIYLATPRSTAIDIGKRILVASGVDQVGDADALNTYREILNQALSALGQSLTARLGREAVATQGSAIAAPPSGLDWAPVGIVFRSGALEPFHVAVSNKLVSLLSGEESQALEAPSAGAAFEQGDLNLPAQVGGSKTFDLLLDVALPVSISFGRTYLALKEVIKLTTGSIVELDRAVSEPVDVIVNNCVIARGEVVVVDGNYGVRIRQIASRYDRLRTGASTTQVQHVLTAN